MLFILLRSSRDSKLVLWVTSYSEARCRRKICQRGFCINSLPRHEEIMLMTRRDADDDKLNIVMSESQQR